MQQSLRTGIATFAAIAVLWLAQSQAADVNAISGYTNTFSSQPPAADWTTRSFATGTASTTSSEITSIAALEAAVQTNSAGLFTAQCASASGSPPLASANAVWSSSGHYLQTRPSGVAATLLMARFVNKTGTNGTGVHINYDYTTNRASAVTEQIPGHLVYYSLTGAANDWLRIPALSQGAQGLLSADLTLNGTWSNEATLYLLWADDNGSGSPDIPLNIDNFYLAVTGGASLEPGCTLISPANGQSFAAPASVALAAQAIPGEGATITGVGFYETAMGFLGAAVDAPYNTSINLEEGEYSFYAVATNSLGATMFSGTNRITVATIISGTINRGPWLGSRGETNITIRWRTVESAVGRVRFGLTPAELTSFTDDTVSRTAHSVTLTGLLPDTKYYYSIGTVAGTLLTSTNFYFRTAPRIGSQRSTRIWFLSDYGEDDSTQAAVRDTYLNYIGTNGQSTDVWITGGDNDQSFSMGSDANFQSNVFVPYTNILPHTPIFPCPGNHDGGSSSAYWSIFDVPTTGQSGGYPSGDAHYYSFDFANIHFISLDSFNTSTTVGSPMLAWLTNDLANTTQEWIIAYWHAPVYCKVFYDSDTLSQSVAMRQNFVPLLESYGVDLVLNGHSHSLQRTCLLNRHYGTSSTLNLTNKIDAGNGRIDGTGAYVKTNEAGTVYCVAPTGCGVIRSGSTTHPACLYTLNNTAGFIIIDINTNRLDFRMMTSTGDVGDCFTMLKSTVQEVMAPEFVDVPRLTNGICTLRFQGTPGVTYTLQSAEVLNGSWANRTNITVPAGGTALVDIEDRATSNRFYRVVYPTQ